MNRFAKILFSGLAAIAMAGSAYAVTFAWADIGNPGNPTAPGNTSEPSVYGTVANNYRIAKHEVSNTQYTEFLNAADPTGVNPNGIYSTNMTSDTTFGGINFSAGNGVGFKYAPKAGFEMKPVVYVSWNDSARFANWMQNGQGGGSTESGAYDMNQTTPIRSLTASFFLPSEDEWYKAAY